MSTPAKEQSDGRPVAILGAGLSGRGVDVLCRKLGRQSVFFDEVIPGARRDFDASAVPGFSQVVVSPGFSPRHPWRRVLAEAVDAGTIAADAVYGELGFALSNWAGKVLGVTGTNGKTTAARLLHAVIAAEVSPARAHLAGNIGIAASGVVAVAGASGPEDWLVCEISSFQADLPHGIELDGLAWTNFADDHIDYHGSEIAYFKAKANLFGCLREGAPVIMDDGVAAMARRLNCDLPASSIICPAGRAGEGLHALPPESPFAWGPQRMNYDKVCRLATALGFREATVCAEAARLELPAHRLAEIATVDGVSYWNDSKATNPDAALAAIRSFDEPLVWIAGGRNKAFDLEAFARGAGSIKPAVTVTYGAVGETFAGKLREQGCDAVFRLRFVDAVCAAAKLARERGLRLVVLSPGFASYDQFASFADRGKTFNSLVLSLKA